MSHSKAPRVTLRSIGKVVLLGALLLTVGCAAYGPHHAEERVYPDVVFSTVQGQSLAMDLYVPKTAQPAPVVIWIFGGSWRIGSKGYHVNLRDLTKYGIAVASIQYRLTTTATYPAQLDDCRAAVSWLRANGSRYGINPSKIGISGESAGGHLAALVGTVEGAPAIRAVCALYPPTDLVSLGREYETSKEPSAVDRLLGGRIEQKLALAAQASPVNHVSASSPPFLIFHGDRDELVPLAQSEDLVKRLKRAGVEARLIVVPGKPHWFLLTEAQVAEAARFFERHFRS